MKTTYFLLKKKCEDKNDKVNENVLQVLENLIKNASLHFWTNL